MTYVSYKGTVKCEYCGFISLYGYQDKDKICFKCGRGFFRFNAYETWKLNLGETKWKTSKKRNVRTVKAEDL